MGRVILIVLVAASLALAQEGLVTVTQDFSTDPGWQGIGNRVEASGAPTVKQDFGWSPDGSGKIGGTIWKSTTPAWYGMPLSPPLSFKDKFSASGKLAVMPEPGVAYLGFFNHERQGWRAWSSMALRIVCKEGSPTPKASLFIDAMSGRWQASGVAEIAMEFPADGSEHTWKFTYDPDATRPAWSDKNLESCMTTARQEIPQIVAKMQKLDPQVTRDEVRKRLQDALEKGLVTWLARHRTEYWVLKEPKEDLQGEITVQVDNGPQFKSYMRREVRNQPVTMDRFGIFNMQMYHGPFKFYVSDLVVNAKKVDLSKDPGWEGHNNRTEFVERDFQRQNFGYSADTNFAGGSKGEIGGQFYNVEPIDPLHGCYADDVGKLTLDDPIRFKGKLSFIEGSTDAGMFFGYFRAADERIELPANIPNSGGRAWPQPNTLGIVVDGPARIGWYFSPRVTADQAGWPQAEVARKISRDAQGPVILPTRTPRTFEFTYDPKANNGLGRITVILDGEKPVTVDLTPEQRKAGATFDRFGLMSFRRGGKYSTLFFDDLSYTARRPKDYQPVRHEQKITTVPYPRGGRKF